MDRGPSRRLLRRRRRDILVRPSGLITYNAVRCPKLTGGAGRPRATPPLARVGCRWARGTREDIVVETSTAPVAGGCRPDQAAHLAPISWTYVFFLGYRL